MALSSSCARTEKKLLYAGIHIRELACYEKATSNDNWENAHQESCFFHLSGAVDSILHEINDGYSLRLDITHVNWRRVAQRLGETDQTSPAFVLCSELKRQEGSWLNLLFEWRNHGAHRCHVGKVVWAAGDNQFKDPRNGMIPDVFRDMGCQQVLECLTKRVRELVDRCRASDPNLRQPESGGK